MSNLETFFAILQDTYKFLRMMSKFVQVVSALVGVKSKLVANDYDSYTINEQRNLITILL